MQGLFRLQNLSGKITLLTYVTAFLAAILISCQAEAQKFNLALSQDEKPYQTDNL